MSNFTLYVKRKGGSKEDAEKAVTYLKAYLPAVIEKSSAFTGSDARLVEGDVTPSLLPTDVVVYMVRGLHKSIIEKKGGDVSIAHGDERILGLTDLNLKICEVYYDRMFQGSPKELAGACYHEAAHIKSDMDNKMHENQNGFLTDAPDYNGKPTTSNNEFLAKHLGRKVNMNSGY